MRSRNRKTRSRRARLHPAGRGCDRAAPVVEDGWDAVLTEAKNANIPVIIVDRSVKADSSLYAAHIGSNMELEGKKAGDEMNKLLPNGGKIIELSAPPAPAPRLAAPRASAKRSTRTSRSSTRRPATSPAPKAKPVMEAFLKKYGSDIQGLCSSTMMTWRLARSKR
jgi:galactofuranose transport system substrate-binding protein